MRKKYHTFAVGWTKTHQSRGDFLSCSANGKGQKVKLMAELENGETVMISSFAAFFNDDKPSDKAPDVQFVFTTEED